MQEALYTGNKNEFVRILILILLGLLLVGSLCVFTQTSPPRDRVWVLASER